MKVVALDGYTENPSDLSWDGLAVLGGPTIYDRTPTDQILSRISDAGIVITSKTPPIHKIFTVCPGIRYVGILATGYNVVDIEAAKEKGIPVINTPTYGTAAVAQMMFALLLETCHHAGEHSEAVHRGEWTESPDSCFWNAPLIELAGKTIGVIDFGRTGQNMVQIVRAFNLQVLVYDEYPSDAAHASGNHVILGELSAQSDIISLHRPLSPSTEGVINKDSIVKIKDGAILINTSRDLLITEADLIQASNSDKVYAVGLDVAATEPTRADNPLLNVENYIITPHAAWAPKESRTRLIDIAVNSLKALLKQKLVNAVNA